MILENNLNGKNILLRTAEPEDAEFILSLRCDPELGKYLKQTDPSVEKQRKWIAKKKIESNDYHLIIENKSNESLGVIAIYEKSNIKWDTGDFDWGRWLISRKAPITTAFESTVILYNFAFFYLNLHRALFEVRKNNKKLIAYHHSYGANIVSTDDVYVWFEFTVNPFLNNKKMMEFKNLFLRTKW